ncbi:MAG: RHS repeat-associated core domain-containing protein, partial [Nitrospira sp.]
TTLKANGATPVSYGYDAASRLIQVAQAGLGVGLGYDNANRRTSLTYPNGTSTSYAYDVASRLTNINHIGPSGIIEALTYQYDAAGNRISLTRMNGAASNLPAAVQAAYIAANEQVTFNSLPATFDANGNQTTSTDASGTTTYNWDARNRLTSISGPGVTAAFQYDALGRRVSKTINGATTDYLYDGLDIVAEIGGGAVGATYLRSLNIDEPFVWQSSSNEFYHTDALGSTLALTDDAGAVQTTYSYEAFGKTTVTGTSSNRFQYTGRENDNTGLLHYRVRYYSPVMQRFVRRDPVGLFGGINFYAYVSNSPLRYRDPLGLEKSTTLGWDVFGLTIDAGWGYTIGSTGTQCFIATGCSEQTVFPPSFGFSLDIAINKPSDDLNPINAWLGLGQDLSVGTFLYENPNFGPDTPAFIQEGVSISLGPSIGLPFGISR